MPVHAYIDISLSCPLKCKYCFVKKESKFLSLDRAREFFEYLSDLGIQSVQLSGGEPFTNERISEICELACEYFDGVYIVTSAYFNDRIKTVEGTVDGISLSADYFGSRHDEYRGVKGLFKKVISTLINYPFASLRTTIFNDNLRDIERYLSIVKYPDKTLGVERDIFYALVPVKIFAERSPSGSQVLHILDIVFRENLVDRVIVDHPSVRLFYAFMVGAFKGEAITENIKCSACEKWVYVDINGVIRGCPFKPVPVGKIGMNLDELKENLKKVRKKEYESYIPQVCLNCPFRNICGGCPASSNKECVIKAIFSNIALPVETIRLVHKRGGGERDFIDMAMDVANVIPKFINVKDTHLSEAKKILELYSCGVPRC